MSDYLPVRLTLQSETKAEAVCMAARRVARIRLIAEGAETMLVADRGCEISRADMLELFGLVYEEAQSAGELLALGAEA